MCRLWFFRFVIFGGFQSLFLLLTSFASSKARPKKPHFGNPRSSPFWSTSLSEEKVHGFFCHTTYKSNTQSPQKPHTSSHVFLTVSTLSRYLFKRDRSLHIRALFPRVAFFKSPTITELSVITSKISLYFLGRPSLLILLAALCLRLCCVDGLILS